MDAREVLRKAREADLRLVRFMWCGNDGTIRAKASGLVGLESRLLGGIGLTVGMQAMNALDQLQPVAGMGPVGEVRLVPDLATFRVLPFAPRSGALICDHVQLDGQPAPVCQRSFLKRMVAASAERERQVRVAFENEFTLADRLDDGYQPLDASLCFSTIGMSGAQQYIDDLIGALQDEAIALEQYYAELGPGQQEISATHAPALDAADQQLFVRETIRGVAARHGLLASLAPKPWPEAAGNGCHLHVSLWRGPGDNRFYDAAAQDRLSGEAHAFIAGVLEHLPGLCGLTAPSFNSYRRIVPELWAGAFRCWGYDNREAALRVPSPLRGNEPESTNLELKSADATCNPYLAVGGVIAAGLDGLERRLEPPEPVNVDPATMDERQRQQRGIGRLPSSQWEALEALEADTLLTDAMGPVLARSYLAVRRSEWEAYSAGDEAFEQQGHFLKY
jgi:glutamine synthetase